MQLSHHLLLLPSFLLLLTTLSAARDCNTGNLPGTANGECVMYYTDGSCKNQIGSFQPDCSGNCFKFNSFNSLGVAGDGTYGTDCIAYSDDNCQDKMGDTGNHVVGGVECMSVPDAKSMICYYRCHHGGL